MYQKVVTAAEAVAKIPDNAFIGVSGVNVAGTPMELVDAIVGRFEKEGHPRNIDLTNSGNNAYMPQLAIEGLVGVYYAGFPAFDDYRAAGSGFTDDNKAPVFHFTQGIGTQFYRSQANRMPFLTKVGLGTYVDPRIDGACANEKAREFAKEHPVVKIVELGGEEYLHFDLPPVTVALIRGTSADSDGNLINDDESIKNEILPMAMAAHNNGGIVIAQVKNLLDVGTIHGADVKVPGMLVDYVVVCSDPTRWAPQNMLMYMPPEASGRKPGFTGYQPGITGHCNIAREAVPFDDWRPDGVKMMLARRGAAELWPGCVCNVGLGIPTGIPYVAAEEGIEDMYYQTIELGAIGGYTGGGAYFTSAFNARSYLNHDDMFAFIDGKGLDITFLGAGEIGEDGSVNVTRINGRTNGSGGFVNISTGTDKIVFMCTHTAGGKSKTADGKLQIVEQGKPIKFRKSVEQIAFNGPNAVRNGKDVTYMTERAIFKLIDGKLTLVEYAPGLDIERDILAWMGFRPEVSADAKPIPALYFSDGKIGLKARWEEIIAG
jgi:propionate CoA-transferase